MRNNFFEEKRKEVIFLLLYLDCSLLSGQINKPHYLWASFKDHFLMKD